MKRSVTPLLPALCLLLTGSLSRGDSPAGILDRFVDLRIRQMKEKCLADNTELPPAYATVIDAVKAGDNLNASNGFARVRTAQGSYEGVTPEPQLRIEIWKDLRDVYCAFKEFSQWSPDLLDLYSRDILGVIPSNSIYFGGSDSGRFIIMAYQETAGKPFFVLAQNALADNIYMTRLQASIGSAIWLPDHTEVNAAFQQYVDDIQSGRLDPAASGSMDSGPFQEHVPDPIMRINGIVARMIYAKNKETHPFYIEESDVIPWMYPYLQPAGLIMKLNPEPVTLTPDIIAEDRRFWAGYTNTLLSHPAFPRDTRARAAFAKMRAAIGGLYVHARLFAEAEHAFLEARTLFPLSPEASVRLAGLYSGMDRFPDAIAVMVSYTNRSPDNQQATAYLEDLKTRARVTVRARELESLLGSGKGSVKDTLELAEQYRLLKQDSDMLKLLNSITASTNMPPDSYKQTAVILAVARKFTDAAAAQKIFLDQTPGADTDWIDLAFYYLAAGKGEECVQAMTNAIKAGGDKARESLLKDIRFQPIKMTPLFKSLTTSDKP